MASDIDPTVFPDNVKVDKADLREQFTIVKNEIEDLQNSASFTRRMAFNDTDFDTL